MIIVIVIVVIGSEGPCCPLQPPIDSPYAPAQYTQHSIKRLFKPRGTPSRYPPIYTSWDRPDFAHFPTDSEVTLQGTAEPNGANPQKAASSARFCQVEASQRHQLIGHNPRITHISTFK